MNAPNKLDDDTRPFPIQGNYYPGDPDYIKPCTIPWWLAEIAYKYYAERFGTSQSLEQLAERGGFGRTELVALIRENLWEIKK